MDLVLSGLKSKKTCVFKSGKFDYELGDIKK